MNTPNGPSPDNSRIAPTTPKVHLTVVGAYGRHYDDKNAALDDWQNGKDFRIASVGPDMGRYMSKRDTETRPELHVSIRYKSMVYIVDTVTGQSTEDDHEF
jgi:hypothetical protein